MQDRFSRFSYAITEISRHWHKLTADEMAKFGLKGTHCIYLLTLYQHPDGLTAPQLCTLCDRDKADVSRMTGIMEEKGLLSKEYAGSSKYRGVFRLTELGIQAAKQVQDRASLAVSLAGRDMTEEAREVFYTSLESILKNLRQLSKQGLPDT